MPLAASTEKVAVAAAACIFSKKNERRCSLEVARAIFPLKNNAFLIFWCRHGLDSSPGFLSWIPLLDSSPGFLSWIPPLDSFP